MDVIIAMHRVDESKSPPSLILYVLLVPPTAALSTWGVARFPVVHIGAIPSMARLLPVLSLGEFAVWIELAVAFFAYHSCGSLSTQPLLRHSRSLAY